MAQSSESANAGSAFNGEPKKKRNVAVITGITGQVPLLNRFRSHFKPAEVPKGTQNM